MSAPIKHAPGVMCIVRRGPPPRHASPFFQESAEKAWREIDGSVCTIESVAGSQLWVRGRCIELPQLSEPTWQVVFPRPMPLPVGSRSGLVEVLHTTTLVLTESQLIPIAGPGIDVNTVVEEVTSTPAPAIPADANH